MPTGQDQILKKTPVISSLKMDCRMEIIGVEFTYTGCYIKNVHHEGKIIAKPTYRLYLGPKSDSSLDIIAAV